MQPASCLGSQAVRLRVLGLAAAPPSIFQPTKHPCSIIERVGRRTCLAQHLGRALALHHARLIASVQLIGLGLAARVGLQPGWQAGRRVGDAAAAQDLVAELDLLWRGADVLQTVVVITRRTRTCRSDRELG